MGEDISAIPRGEVAAQVRSKDMTNEGPIDRVLRVIVGIALIAIVFVGPQTPWGWIGVVPLLTGLVAFCPLYRIIGVNTCSVKRS